MIERTLQSLGWSDKQIKVYLALLRLGPSPVRKIGLEAEINRGTTYDILKALREQGVVSYYHKKTRQYFVAEDPVRLLEAVDAKVEGLQNARSMVERIVPQMRSLYAKGGERPVVKSYEGVEGVRLVLQDVLSASAETEPAEYYAYSAPEVRSRIYEALPQFTKKRINAKIKTKVIGREVDDGQTHGLDERKSISAEDAPSDTYMFIYAGKVAYVSSNGAGESVGMIIENDGIYHVQKQLFESLWNRI